ncbi:ABC-type antimicrobial peptide transport system, ATPase component [hydrothermal vent metagenome]|uniref:ABC-type antimicrobial peptide transport system, ATPase component n=1 Tax=hydrothermal vent metagenome TaxID=652676 RepID=A0A3B0ZKI6_9ZZZZ
MSTPFLKAENVSKILTSGDKPLQILKTINLTFSAASTNAIVGASGSGKTTLLGLLAGLDLPSEGSIYFANQDLTKLSEDGRAELRAGQVAFIFQSFQLLQHLTAYENVLLSMEILNSGQAKEKTLSILDRVGLSHRLEHYPNQLSGGEQQRCAIARAFVIEPILLFADEPTGNLDLKTGQTVVDLLFELNQERQTSLVIATHDTNLANRCERVITLSGGEVLSDELNK